MKTIDVRNLPTTELQYYLQHAIAPRPICLASTIDAAGRVNLSPFSFFNLFSTDPPICIFSPSRRVRDNTTKHTLENVLEVPEVVINIVDYAMVQQVSLSSSEYQKGVNEFEKAGLTMLPSHLVRPPRVRESKVQLECSVDQVIPLGSGPGAGNLVLAQVQLMHFSEDIFAADGKIDQAAMDLVARLGGDWYCRASGENLFQVEKPLRTRGIGVDALPVSARSMGILSGNELGILGNLERLPNQLELDNCARSIEVARIILQWGGQPGMKRVLLHKLAKEMIGEGRAEMALAAIVLGR